MKKYKIKNILGIAREPRSYPEGYGYFMYDVL
jgi:hypothetical protein